MKEFEVTNMGGIPYYFQKFEYLTKHQARIWIRKLHNITGYNYELINKFRMCPIAWEKAETIIYPTELHHRLHNTKTNRTLYPVFINSLINLLAINHDYHMKYGNYGKILLNRAYLWEQFLNKSRHWKCRHFVLTAEWYKGTKEEFFKGKVEIV